MPPPPPQVTVFWTTKWRHRTRKTGAAENSDEYIILCSKGLDHVCFFIQARQENSTVAATVASPLTVVYALSTVANGTVSFKVMAHITKEEWLKK